VVRADAVSIAGPHEPAIAAVTDRLEAYFKATASLAADAERLADEHLRSAGREAVGLDRRRVVQMIQEKLARERGFPL